MSSKLTAKKTPWILNQSNVYKRTLPRLAKAHHAGDEAALYDAIVLIDFLGRHKKDEYRVPDWVWYGLVTAYENSIRRRVPTRKGPGGSPSKRYEMNRVHFRRYLVAKHFIDDGETVGLATEHAQESLAGTSAQGSAGGIKKSYYRVKAALSVPAAEGRFRTPGEDAHELLRGI